MCDELNRFLYSTLKHAEHFFWGLFTEICRVHNCNYILE